MLKAITEKQYLKALEIVKAYKLQCEQSLAEIESVLNDKSDILFSDVHSSVRLYTAICENAELLGLPEYNKIKMSHFKELKVSEIKRFRKMGDRTIQELQILCKEYGVTLH